jgi:hypothetical protein
VNTRTVAEVMDPTDIAIPAHLEGSAEIPVLHGLQAQGDVLVLPAVLAGFIGTGNPTPVPPEGIEVVRGENGAHPHLLVADGPGVIWDSKAIDGFGLGLGVLDVPEGSTAYLLHPEHGANGIGAGIYSIRRQRELGAAGERRVAD